MVTLTAFPDCSMGPPYRQVRILPQVALAWTGRGLRDGFSQRRAQPGGGKSQNEASDCVERGPREGSRAQGGKRLPLIGGKGAECADKAYWNQESPGGIQVDSFAQVGDGKANQDAGRDVDDEGAVGKLGSHAAGDRGADPIARDGTERAPNGNQQVFLHSLTLH